MGYIVRPGDTFYGIATTCSVSVSNLTASNPQIPDPTVLAPGNVVCVPSNCALTNTTTGGSGIVCENVCSRIVQFLVWSWVEDSLYLHSGMAF